MEGIDLAGVVDSDFQGIQINFAPPRPAGFANFRGRDKNCFFAGRGGAALFPRGGAGWGGAHIPGRKVICTAPFLCHEPCRTTCSVISNFFYETWCQISIFFFSRKKVKFKTRSRESRLSQVTVEVAHCCTIFLKSSGYRNIDDRHRNPNIHIISSGWAINYIFPWTYHQLAVKM